MSGNLSVLNKSRGAIYIFVDDALLFRDVLPGEITKKKPVPTGTGHAIVINNREKIIGDFLFSVQKNACILLTVTDAGAFVSQIPPRVSGKAPFSRYGIPAPEKHL